MSEHMIAISFLVVTLTAAAGLIADAAIIYSVFRFRKLRTIPNKFLANWAIADSISIMMLPMISVIMLSGPFSHEYTCIIIHGNILFHLGAIMFGTLLSIDWCAAAYYHRISEKLRKRYLLPIAAVWIIVLILFSISAGLCISHIHYYVSIILFIGFYAINVLIVVILQISRILKKFSTTPPNYPEMLNVRLTVTTIITLSYLFAAINVCLEYFNMSRHFQTTSICVLLSVLSIVCSSIATLVVLCRLDKDFKMYLFSNDHTYHERFENNMSELDGDSSKNNVPPVSFNNPVHTQTNANSYHNGLS